MSPTSGVIGEAWNLYKAHWRHLLSISFVVYLAVALVGVLLVAILTWVGAILAALISLVAIFWLQATLVKAVDDVRDGRADLSVSDTFEAARAHLAAVLVAGLIAGIGISHRVRPAHRPGARAPDLLVLDRAVDRDRREERRRVVQPELRPDARPFLARPRHRRPHGR